jgi:hypothetical protein
MNASGVYLVKFHDRAKYQGMTSEEREMIQGNIVRKIESE